MQFHQLIIFLSSEDDKQCSVVTPPKNCTRKLSKVLSWCTSTSCLIPETLTSLRAICNVVRTLMSDGPGSHYHVTMVLPAPKPTINMLLDIQHDLCGRSLTQHLPFGGSSIILTKPEMPDTTPVPTAQCACIGLLMTRKLAT